MLSVTPTVHWLEWVDWAEKIVEEPLKIIDGHAIASNRAGNGLTWDARAIERYRM
jgi:mandelate racemase